MIYSLAGSETSGFGAFIGECVSHESGSLDEAFGLAGSLQQMFYLIKYIINCLVNKFKN